MLIYPFLSIEFIFFSLVFLFALYCSFYLPGLLITNKLKLPLGLHILISFVLGMVLWGFQGYIFGYLGLRFMTYGYLLLTVILAFRLHLITLKPWKEALRFIRSNLFLSSFITLGVIGQMILVFGSGLLYKEGVRFYGVNGVDGVMHLAFIRSIVDYFPPVEPGAYGHPITNYHYWSDLILAELVRIWHLPISHTFFSIYSTFYLSFDCFGCISVYETTGVFKEGGVVGNLLFIFCRRCCLCFDVFHPRKTELLSTGNR